MRYLLDVNILIALIDPAHVAHETAHEWFADEGHKGWATCPITENGVIRILGNPRYPNSPGSPAAAAIVRQLRAHPGHEFWPDTFSLLDPAHVDADQLLSASQFTDSYLLGLAIAQGELLATLDRRLSINAVKGGQSALQLIG